MNVTLVPRTGLKLRSPVVAASGTIGYGDDLAQRVGLEGLGAVVCKGTTREPRPGNEPLRMVETPAGMLNSIGLQNIGVERLVREKAPIWSTWDVPVFVNVSATSIEDYRYVVSLLDGVPGVAGIELNISCPNVEQGGVMFGVRPELASQATRAARDCTALPLVVKLTPNVVDIGSIAQAAEDAGADAISLVNTVHGMAIDSRARRAALAPGTGGLSGPAIKPLALYLVHEVARKVTVPIIGMGGILTWEDALEFLLAGASAVGIATVLLVDPTAPRAIAAGLEQWMRREGAAGLDELVGAANPDAKRKAGEGRLAGSR